MASRPEITAQLLAATRASAAALIDDLSYIRRALKQSVEPGEIRRLSAVLRRLLVEDDLRSIASARLDRKIKINAADNTIFYNAEKLTGVSLISFSTMPTQPAGDGLIPLPVMEAPTLIRAHRRMKKLNPGPRAVISLPLHKFMDQRVLCLRGEWVNRRDTIKYMANVGSGVHSSSPTSAQEFLLTQIARSADYEFGENGLQLDILPAGVDNRNAPFRYSPRKLNPVMVELLSTARFLEQSPHVVELERIIHSELARL